MSVKAVRVDHAKGLLPEPERDSSGYRRDTAQHAIDLITIRTLAEAGLPLARIRRTPPPDDAERILRRADAALTARIRGLRRTQRRLRDPARRAVAATRHRYGTGDLPGQAVPSDVPALVAGERALLAGVATLRPARPRRARRVRAGPPEVSAAAGPAGGRRRPW